MTHETTRGKGPARQEATDTQTDTPAREKARADGGHDPDDGGPDLDLSATITPELDTSALAASLREIGDAFYAVAAELEDDRDMDGLERAVQTLNQNAPDIIDGLDEGFGLGSTQTDIDLTSNDTDDDPDTITDGGHAIDPEAWYVYDSQRDAVVDGPIATRGIAQQAATEQGIDYLVVDGAALESIQGDTRLVWETGDVDVVTDGGTRTGTALRRVTVRVPVALVGRMDAAVERNEYPSRSEAIRAAVRDRFGFDDGDPRLVADGQEGQP